MWAQFAMLFHALEFSLIFVCLLNHFIGIKESFRAHEQNLHISFSSTWKDGKLFFVKRLAESRFACCIELYSEFRKSQETVLAIFWRLKHTFSLSQKCSFSFLHEVCKDYSQKSCHLTKHSMSTVNGMPSP